MTSALRREANRFNARKSTGPKTLAGKLRASRNGVRHGLCLPVRHDPLLGPQVAALARAIAGGAEALAEPARRIAEAQIDLVRIRRARHEVLREALAGPEHASPRLDLPTVRLGLTLLIGPEWACLAPYFPHAPEHPGDLMSLFTRYRRRLTAFDRYERRARARRRSAIQAFDAAVCLAAERAAAKAQRHAAARCGTDMAPARHDKRGEETPFVPPANTEDPS